VVYYRDGRTATVSASAPPQGRISIATNGKPDGSLDPIWLQACAPGDSLRAMGGDDPTQLLLAMITLAHRPAATQAAVIGHGTGMSSHVLLASPTLESLVTIEIEPRMVEASRVFYPANRRVFDDPRSRHVFDDAKSYFAAANRTYDIIMAEPSNPWVSGVSGLFTDEFYARVRGYLAPGGVLGQWLHTYELTDDLVLSVLSAIHRNFSDYDVYAVNLADLLIVATPEGRLPAPDWGVFELPEVRRDVCHFHPILEADLRAARLSGRAALGPLLEIPGQVNSDFFPVLDLGAERARFLGRAAAGVENLYHGVFDFAGALDLPPLVDEGERSTSLGSIPRVRALVAGAALRARFSRPAPADTAWTAGGREDVDERVLQWVEDLRGEPPETWAGWTRGFWSTFDLWHAGTRGYADPRLVQLARDYLDRHRAPEGPRAAVAFRVGLALRDWRAVAQAAPALVREAGQDRHWVDPDPLREGAVLAHLALGQPDSAAALWQALEGQVRRPPTDLRVRLLRAYLGAALQKP
jgi:hypothetical protein